MEENLEKKLFRQKENGWDTVDTRKKEAIFNFSKDYMNFLNKAKTELEIVLEKVTKVENQLKQEVTLKEAAESKLLDINKDLETQLLKKNVENNKVSITNYLINKY